jgi:hypothetical protein
MRFCRVCGRDLAVWFERLTINAKVATVLGLIQASSYMYIVESEGAADKAVLNIVHEYLCFAVSQFPKGNHCNIFHRF